MDVCLQDVGQVDVGMMARLRAMQVDSLEKSSVTPTTFTQLLPTNFTTLTLDGVLAQVFFESNDYGGCRCCLS
jgi:hypothetical protein